MLYSFCRSLWTGGIAWRRKHELSNLYKPWVQSHKKDECDWVLFSKQKCLGRQILYVQHVAYLHHREYICMHTHRHTTHICIHIHTNTHSHMQTCTRTHTCVCACTHICTDRWLESLPPLYCWPAHSLPLCFDLLLAAFQAVALRWFLLLTN